MPKSNYKGVPKTRDVIVKPGGTLDALGSKESDSVLMNVRASATRYPSFTTRTWYVRPAGNDQNTGKSADDAFATLEKAISMLETNTTNLRQVIDITGMKGSNAIQYNTQLEFPAIFASHIQGLDAAYAGPDNWSNTIRLALLAEVDKIQDITVSSTSSASTTQHTTVNVDETLTPGAHKGQFLLGSGYFEHGVIIDNDSSSVTLCTDNSTFTAPVAIYEYGAEITSGDPSDIYTGATILPCFSPWFISGVKFSSTNDSKNHGLKVYGPEAPALQQSVFTGIHMLGVEETICDCIYIHDQGNNDASFLIHEAGGGGVQFRHSFFEGVACQWDTSWVMNLSCVWDGNTDPVGRHHGNASVIELEKVHVKNSSGIGIRSRGTAYMSLQNVQVDGAGSHAIQILGGTRRHQLSNVQGSGSSGVGCVLSAGAQAAVSGGTSISGTSGQVTVGASSTQNWSAAPTTDVGETNPEFCGIY